MIGYYAHSHGSGHCNYAHLFSKIFGKTLTVFTDRKFKFDQTVDVVRLPNEYTNGSEFDRNEFPEPRALHYAPVNLRKVTERNRLLLNTVLRKNIKLLIIDVSVEVAMLARVSSIPYAYVRLHGERNDVPHLNAYEGASFLLAYYPEEMEGNDTPGWIKSKTVYLGFLSRYMFGAEISRMPLEYRGHPKPILVNISGFGGSLPLDFSVISNRYSVYSIGPGIVLGKNSDSIQIGVVESTRAFIEHADMVVAACGSNTVSEIISLGKSFVAIPQERPYREQELTAENLDRLGWATNLRKHADLNSAVGACESLASSELITVDSKKLSAFFWTLKMLDFRADRLVVHSIKNHNTEQISILELEVEKRPYTVLA